MKKKHLIFTCVLGLFAAQIEAETIQIYCPSKIDFTPQTKPWASYGYTAYTNVNLPALGNQIKLTGEGDATPNSVPILQSADWTDQTFLCNYAGKTINGTEQVMVLYETVLANYVTSCRFSGNASSCNTNNNPLDCPISCVLNN